MRDASLPITLIVVGVIGLVWYFRWLPTPWFAWLERRLGWHTMITALPGSASTA